MTESFTKVQQEWSNQFSIAKPLVESLVGKLGGITPKEIEQSLKELILFLFRQNYSNDPFIKAPTKIDWVLVAQELTTTLLAALIEEPPKKLFFRQPDVRQSFLFSTGSALVLQPRDIVLTIDRFGLLDNQPKEIKELSKKYGIGSSTIASRLYYTRDFLRKSPIREFVLNLPPTEPVSPNT